MGRMIREKTVILGYNRSYWKVVNDMYRAISLEVFVIEDESRSKDPIRLFVNAIEVDQDRFDFMRDLALEEDD